MEIALAVLKLLPELVHGLVVDDLAAGEHEVLRDAHLGRQGEQNAGLEPLVVDKGLGGAGGHDGDDVGILDGGLDAVADRGLHIGERTVDIINEILRGGGEEVVDLHALETGAGVLDGGKASTVDDAAADDGNDLRVGIGKVADANAGDGAGAHGADEVAGHERLRRAGVGVVERDHQDRAGQTFFEVLMIRAVPLAASHVEAAADVCGHGHEAAVGTGDRHVGERRGERRDDLDAVGVVVDIAHQIVALTEQTEHLLHRVDAVMHIGHASLDHIILAEVQKIDLGIHGCILLS